MNKYLMIIGMAVVLFWSAGCEAQTEQNNGGDVSAKEFKALIDGNPEVIVVDVRTDGEVATGMIPGAKHIEWTSGNFETEIGTLDKDKKILLYCASGSRSHKAMVKMNEMGYKNVYNMQGGIGAWVNEEYPLIK